VDLTDAKIGAAQGRIALQIHDGGGIKVLWRNLQQRQSAYLFQKISAVTHFISLF